MRDEFPALKDGDPLEPWHLNLVYAELRRWRKLHGGAGISVNGADGSDGGPTIESTASAPFYLQLTGSYAAGPPAGYPWAEVIFGPNRAVQTTGVVGSAATGDPAFERTTGDQTLGVGNAVYEARRAPGSNQVLFGLGAPGLVYCKNTGGSIATGATGTVTEYLADAVTLGTTTHAALLALTGPLAVNKNCYCCLIKGVWHIVQADCP